MNKSFEKWDDINFAKIEADVFHLQQRIFINSKNGKRKQVHRLQRLLVSSVAAKCVAVSRVTEINSGRDTAGFDGMRSLTDEQKLRLVGELSLRRTPSLVKRVWIPKPGKDEKRPLGIPTILDRAQQALITLALEPEWEAHFGSGTYGFRKGRSAHDAIVNIRSVIQFSPQWVLDADIEKFFDRVDHQALLAKLNTYPQMETAIRRILKAGILEGSVLTHPEEGTPQGGPLSPLLANVALHGMEADLKQASMGWMRKDGTKVKRPARMVCYADDFIVFHEHKEIVEKSKDFITEWLRPMGLTLHPGKTRTVHTLDDGRGAQPGFDFLGHHIQQFHTGKYAVKACFRQVYTHIAPSSTAQKRIYRKVAETITQLMAGPPSPQDDRVRILIWRLNPMIRGWANYFRHCNAKQTFSRLDHLVWIKLWKALRVRYRRKGRIWTVKNFLRDEQGRWCLRHTNGSDGEVTVLRNFADTAIRRHYPVRGDRSFFDGDWAYWAGRRGAYPGLAPGIGRLLKKQAGRCRHCRNAIVRSQPVTVLPAPVTASTTRLSLVLMHTTCATEFRSVKTGDHTVASAVRSPVR